MFSYLYDSITLHALSERGCRHRKEWIQAHWSMYKNIDALRTAASLYSDPGADYPVVVTRVGTPTTPSPDIIEWCEKEQINVENFNHSIHILIGIKNCTHMLNGCLNFNQFVTIPNTVIDCVGMFENCLAFNQELNLPENLNSCSYMLYNCKSFNKQFTLPKSVQAAVCMIAGCDNLKSLPMCENKNFDITSLVLQPAVICR